jgi:hypothetical protein
VRGTIGPWLHGVAYRIAIGALSDRARRRRHEGAAAALAATAIAPAEPNDLSTMLHEEIGRHPESFRAPIVLCYLEELTHDQAAQRLGWPVGAVRSRLYRGHDRLRSRLDGHGRDLFHDAGSIDSENTVEFARLISPDLLVVHGRFRPDAGKPEWPFVQMRVKHGDRWLLSKLWLFLKPGT